MANGEFAGIMLCAVLIVIGIVLLGIGSNFSAQASSSNNTTGQSFTTQTLGGSASAFYLVGGLALALGVIVGLIIIFAPFGGGSSRGKR